MGCGSSSPESDISDTPVDKETLTKIGFTDDAIIGEILGKGLTNGRLMKFCEEFKMIDSDGSGQIDFAEMKVLLVKMWEAYPEYSPTGNGAPQDADVQARIAKFDANSDGKVSQGEYLRYMIVHH